MQTENPILQSKPITVVIIGCGYTGRRVAREMLGRNARVIATTRHVSNLEVLRSDGVAVRRLDVCEPDTLSALSEEIPKGASILLSVPILRCSRGLFDPTPRLLKALKCRPSRLVYLSTTGVYGKSYEVDDRTLVAPVTDRQKLRVNAEKAVSTGPWSSLILRPAAIYGPKRGVHAAMRKGRFKLVGGGENLVSRIHVDDLARLVVAALESQLTGAFPVADEGPCTSHEIATFCAKLLDLPPPISAPSSDSDETRLSNRKVDGSTIRQALGITLQYPTYKSGIPASLAIRNATPSAG